jgi:hypothetical protein
MLCNQTILDPEDMDVLELPRSTRGLQPNELAIVITSHLYPSHDLVTLCKKVEDAYSEIREAAPQPFERSLDSRGPNGTPSSGHAERSKGAVAWLRPCGSWILSSSL